MGSGHFRVPPRRPRGGPKQALVSSWSGGGGQNTGTPSEPKRRAAQYVRMSTEHQRYSTETNPTRLLVTLRIVESRSFAPIQTKAKAGFVSRDATV